MKKILLISCAMLALVSCNQVVDTYLQKVASEANKQCPMVVDKETRLDNMVALPGKVFQYRYTLVNYTKDKIDTNMAKTSLRPNMVQSIKTLPELKYFRDNKVTMQYLYRDMAGAYVMMIQINPDEFSK